jgi:hypothetical protein
MQATLGRRAGARALRLAILGALAAVILVGLNAGSAQARQIDGGSTCTFGDITDIFGATACSPSGGGSSGGGSLGGGWPGGGLPGGDKPKPPPKPDGGTPQPKRPCGVLCRQRAENICKFENPDAFREDLDEYVKPLAKMVYEKCLKREMEKGDY